MLPGNIFRGFLYRFLTEDNVFAVNWAFTYPYWAFDLISPECILSALVMLIVTIMTGALTTRLKQQEKLKADAEKERMRGNLLRAVSHDLRTPLTSIYGACSVMIENYDEISKDRQLKLLSNVRSDSQWLIRIARKDSMIPLIVLSARTEETDKVKALDLGANDYITKPFGTAELLARVRAALRISRLHTQSTTPSTVFSLEDMVIDYDRRQVAVNGTLIHVTQTEYNILAFLSQHVGKVMTYSAIIRSIWGSMDDGSIKKLQVNMANIRKKLGCRPGENRYIINELGVGYRMADPQE